MRFFFMSSGGSKSESSPEETRSTLPSCISHFYTHIQHSTAQSVHAIYKILLILNSYECGCMHWNLDNIFTARTNNCILTVRFSRLSSFLFVLLFSFRVAVRLSPLLFLFLFSFRVTARLPPLLFLLLF